MQIDQALPLDTGDGEEHAILHRSTAQQLGDTATQVDDPRPDRLLDHHVERRSRVLLLVLHDPMDPGVPPFPDDVP